MFRFFLRHQTPLSVVIAVLLPLIVYRANATEPAETTLLDRLVLAATAPLRAVLMAATGAISDAWYDYAVVVDSREDNAALRLRLTRLEHENAALAALKTENEALRFQLQLSLRNPEHPLVAARVIGAGISPEARTIEVDRGAVHGVRRGHPVIAAEGMVGVVQRVAWNSAEVALLADPRVSGHVLVVRSRATGRVEGGPRLKLELSGALQADDVVVGDRVETSGMGGVYPAGIPVGIVTEIEASGQQRSWMTAHVDFDRLEVVSVVLMPELAPVVATPEPLLPRSLRWSPSDAGVDPDAGPTDLGVGGLDFEADLEHP